MTTKIEKPSRMVRKQILITEEQSRLLDACARGKGVPASEIIRSALDRELRITPDSEDWRAALDRFFEMEPLGEDFAKRVADNRKAWSTSFERRVKAVRRAFDGEA
jgi:hypothetical protein